jgi:hypothetical protein
MDMSKLVLSRPEPPTEYEFITAYYDFGCAARRDLAGRDALTKQRELTSLLDRMIDAKQYTQDSLCLRKMHLMMSNCMTEERFRDANELYCQFIQRHFITKLDLKYA